MLAVEERELNNFPKASIERKESIIGIRPYPQAYTREVLKNIKLVNFSDDDKAKPFGSYIYRVQQYPGDIDLIEEYRNTGTVDEVITKFKNKLVSIVKNIRDLKLHYMMEFKMGLDKFYDIDIGTLDRGIYTPNLESKIVDGKRIPSIVEGLERLKRKQLISTEEVNEILSILYSGQILDGDDYDVIYDILREKRVLRWSDDDILAGKKKETDGSYITIEEALKYNTHVKIDMITKIEDKFVEITNFLFLITKVKIDNGEEREYIINFGRRYDKSFLKKRTEKDLPAEIEKLFFSYMNYNPFKGAKRMWALARHYKDYELLGRLKDLISGNISLLYMLKSEIGTMLRLLGRLIKNKRSIPRESINKNIELIKERVGYVLNISTDRYHNFVNKLNQALLTKNMKEKYDILDSVEYLFKNIIDVNTISYLKTHGLSMIPRVYMPEDTKYVYDRFVDIE